MAMFAQRLHRCSPKTIEIVLCLAHDYRVPRSLLKRWMPNCEEVRNHKHLRCLARFLHEPGIWRLNRHSVAGAFFIGLFVAFVPVPFQMLLAALIAICVRANLPISVALVWLTNPLTMPPLFYLAYKVGLWVLAVPAPDRTFAFSWKWLMDSLAEIWQPFLLGCLIVGLASGLVGYLGVQLAWRQYVLYKWRKRGHKQALARIIQPSRSV